MLYRVTIVVTGPIVPGQVHKEATPTEEEAVLLHDQARGHIGPIPHVALPTRGRVRLQAGAPDTEVLLVPIVQGVRVAEVPGTEVPAEVVREVRDSEARAGDPEVPVVRLEAQVARPDLQEVRSDLVAEADQVVADQVEDEADNNSINRLKKY